MKNSEKIFWGLFALWAGPPLLDLAGKLVMFFLLLAAIGFCGQKLGCLPSNEEMAKKERQQVQRSIPLENENEIPSHRKIEHRHR